MLDLLTVNSLLTLRSTRPHYWMARNGQILSLHQFCDTLQKWQPRFYFSLGFGYKCWGVCEHGIVGRLSLWMNFVGGLKNLAKILIFTGTSVKNISGLRVKL